jgi:hypothetical protein
VGTGSALYRGEWFEVGEASHDCMFEVLPPLWIRGEMFAMREFLTGSITMPGFRGTPVRLVCSISPDQ